MNKLLQKVAKLTLGLAMAAGVGVAVSAGRKDASPAHAATRELTFDLTSNPGGWPTTNSTTETAYNYTLSGVTYEFTLKNVKQNSGYLMLTSTAALGLPKLSDGKLTKIVAHNSSGCSTSTRVGISSSVSSASYISGGAYQTYSSTNKDYTYTLSGTSDNTRYYIYVTNRNCQLTSLTLTYQVADSYTISYNANGGSSTMPSTTGTNPAVAACTFTPPSGKQFSYWHTTSSGTGGTTYAVGDTPKKNLSLYAIWEDLPSDPFVSLTLTSGSPAYKGSTVTVSATTANLEGSGLNWTVTAGSVTGISSTNTSFTGTLASTGTVTIKAQDNGGDTYDTVSVTVNAVTVSLNESAISVTQSGTSSLTATVNTGSVNWSSNNAKVTVEADSGNALKGNISVAGDATVGSTATITATSTVDSSVKATCTVTVSENPFAALTKVVSADDVTTEGVYALSPDGTRFVGNSISNSGLVYPITDYSNVGFFKINASGNLQLVTESNGSWSGGNSDYINNSSSTNLSKGTASSVWEAVDDEVDSVVQGVMFENTSNSNRYLGLGTSDVTTATTVKAYALQNLHAGNNNLPVYIYEVPQNKLDGLTVSGQTTTFTAGSTFSLGNNAVLTAHYSSTGNTTDLSGGTISYKINNVDVTTNTTLDHDTHNGKSVVITYTDAAGDKASTTAYTITVNYKPAEGISLNLNSAPLSIGGSVELTATVSDEYADENDVSWSTTSAEIASISAASGTKTITVTGVSAGSATITATANGHSATCAISVTADPILNLKDSGDNIINDETLEYFTGDTSVMIVAVSENVVSPVFNWSNEDDDVVTIDVADEYCDVTIVGAGSSEVSVTVGALTRTVTFSITQSGVTSLTLESSVPSGELFDGTYKNTLTLTPTVTLVGNATGVINWSSSDTNVATVSNASTTAPTAITVTGVGEGTATITARSAYTPSRTATFNVTVTADEVTALSWTKRPKFNSSASGFQKIWAGETTLGDLMSQNGSDSIGVFAPTWKSTKSDTPSMGTGTHDVHIVLSDVGGPTSEAGLTPLTSSYVFQATDNGKYVVAFYEGKASTNNTQLTVTKWRSVIDSSEASGTITWSSSSATVTGDVNATVTNVQYTYYENNSMRLGTGSGGGQIRIDTDANIVSVVVTAKAYSGSRTGTLTVGDQSIEVTNTDYVEFDLLTLDTPTDSMIVSTPSSSVRINIQSIVINCSGSQQIGKTEDCLGLEVYIDTYLHMSDYTTSQGWCKDEEHNYYGKNTETGAKYHFNQLNLHQRTLLSSNSAYADEWERLSAWAAANGESLNGSTILAARTGISPLVNIIGENTNTVAIIVIISMVSVTAIGGYFFLRKRKEN